MIVTNMLEILKYIKQENTNLQTNIKLKTSIDSGMNI